MNITLKYKNYIKQSINKFLLSRGYSDNNIYYLIKNKNVLVNGELVKDKNHFLTFNSVIKVTLNNEDNTLIPYECKLDIVYEDEYLLIVNKEKNVDVEPTKANNDTSLANIVTHYFKNNNIKSKIHLVNRLDKLTSGLVIIAKNQYIHNLMQNIKIDKRYLSLVKGKTNKKGTIKVKIDRVVGSIKREVNNTGKLSITKYKIVKYEDSNSLVDIKLLTGRTHQIRLSFAYINHPLVGDPLYGTDTKENMYLKAYYLSFIHPIYKKKIKVKLTH